MSFVDFWFWGRREDGGAVVVGINKLVWVEVDDRSKLASWCVLERGENTCEEIEAAIGIGWLMLGLGELASWLVPSFNGIR